MQPVVCGGQGEGVVDGSCGVEDVEEQFVGQFVEVHSGRSSSFIFPFGCFSRSLQSVCGFCLFRFFFFGFSWFFCGTIWGFDFNLRPRHYSKVSFVRMRERPNPTQYRIETVTRGY